MATPDPSEVGRLGAAPWVVGSHLRRVPGSHMGDRHSRVNSLAACSLAGELRFTPDQPFFRESFGREGLPFPAHDLSLGLEPDARRVRCGAAGPTRGQD